MSDTPLRSALPEAARQAERERVGELFTAAGAHFVLPTLADLPALLDALHRTLAATG